MEIPVVEPEAAIMFICPDCYHPNYTKDTLEYYSSFTHNSRVYQNIDTDAIDCVYCRKEVRIIRYMV
jgi:hypothetical protein